MNKNKTFKAIICSAAILFAIIVKSLPAIYFHLGSNALKNNNYVTAYKSLKKAYHLDKNNKDYKYAYVQALLKLNPIPAIQKQVFEIANDNLTDNAQQLAQEKIFEWQNNVTYNIGDNYIEQASGDNGIVRWDIKTFPLKVYIEIDNNVPKYYNKHVLNALKQWENTTDFIKFSIVENKKQADIIIKTSETPKDICNENNCKYVVGYTIPKISGNLLKQMTITLYTKDPTGNFFSDKEIYNTILHEIGHALGIIGHSYSSSDLMYMSSDFHIKNNYSFQYLSLQDINTIKLLYKLIPDVTNTPLNKLDTKGLIYTPIILGDEEQINLRKIEEAKNYIQKAPTLPGGYIDLGIAYSQAGRKKEALSALDKALELSKTDNDKFITYYNLSILYFEDKKYDKALKYANIAKGIQNSDDIKELIMQINLKKNK